MGRYEARMTSDSSPGHLGIPGMVVFRETHVSLLNLGENL
jgi:hypothetical protein